MSRGLPSSSSLLYFYHYHYHIIIPERENPDSSNSRQVGFCGFFTPSASLYVEPQGLRSVMATGPSARPIIFWDRWTRCAPEKKEIESNKIFT